MQQEQEWSEVQTEKPEKEKIEFEVEKDEPKKEEIKQEVKASEPEVKKEEQPKELEGINTKGAEKRIRQLIKQRKDRDEEVARLIKQNEELTSKLTNTQKEFTNISKLNLDATEKQLKDKLELARTNYKAAHEEGNTEKILQAQEFLNDAQNDLKSVGATKQQFKEPEVQPQQQVQQPQQQYQQPTPDPKAQSWAEKNDWFGEDKIRTAAALAIDADLKEEGFNPTDDDYYTEIDNRLKEAFPHRYQTQEVEPKEENRTQETSPAQVVAGGTRSTPSSNKKVKLSKEDVRLANKWNIPLEQYAQEKLKATNAEGEYTTINMQRGGK